MKDCINCIYELKDIYENPCIICFNYDKYKSKYGERLDKLEEDMDMVKRRLDRLEGVK